MNRATACLEHTGCSQDSSCEQASRDTGTQREYRGVIGTLNLWYERSKQRRQLLRVADDSTVLKDIGLSTYDLRREGQKPFWRK